MISADNNPGIESELIDLSTVSFDHLRGLNSSALHLAMSHALERTRNLQGARRSGGGTGGQGERID